MEFRDDGGTPAYRARQAAFVVPKRVGIIGRIKQLTILQIVLLAIVASIIPWVFLLVVLTILGILNKVLY